MGQRCPARAAVPAASSEVPPSRSRRVAVIGGGPAGVAACRFLVEAGHEPVVFERSSEFGGIWAPSPPNPVLYRGLVTNIPTVVMQSFDLAFPEHLPSYVRAGDLGRYLIHYADHFGVRPFTKFGINVTTVSPLRSEEEEEVGDSSWRVRWTVAGDVGRAEASVDDFDAVVVANGHYELPYTPEVPGQAEWLAAEPGTRSMVHAREYDDPNQFEGRVVLVVGGRSSGVDIARELSGTAKWVYALDKSCQEVVNVGSCTHVPLGTRLLPDGQLQLPESRRSGSDGLVRGPPVQDLVLATGYQYDFPFLNATEVGLEFIAGGRCVLPLCKHIQHARRPSLYFMGIPLAVPCPVQLFEAQGRWVASRLRHDPTTTAERLAWVEKRRREIGDRQQDFHYLQFGQMEELTRESGFMDAKALKVYLRRMDVLKQVYKDRADKRPDLPWGDDWYRRCQYKVDYARCKWTVVDPPGHGAEDTAQPARL